MNVPGRRQARLADQVRDEAAEIIASELKDPRIGFVTVTRVELTRDLHEARIWVSALGSDQERQMTLEGLTSARGYLRHEISHRLRLRRSPEISIRLDRGAEDSEHMERLIEVVHQQEASSRGQVKGE
jgi:ribosome-binding factor A